MQEKSSDSAVEALVEAEVPAQDHEMSALQRLCLLLINMIPILHIALIALCLLWPALTTAQRWALGALLLYGFPPMVSRCVMWFRPLEATHIAVGSRDYFTWWFLLNIQVVFCRFPALEELLRLVPGLYSFWLRLWGAKIGRLTYWGAGLAILERQFLDIGDNVVFGAGVRLNAHVISPDADGQAELLLSRIKIGDGATVGGYSLLTAGTDIAKGEATRARLLCPPFSVVQGGKRTRRRV